MLNAIRQSRLSRLFWGFMALYLLNVSVDAPDAALPGVAENLTYNDMESVVEVVLEQVLCIEDAIAEHDDPDRDHDSSLFGKKQITFLFYPPVLQVLRMTRPHERCSIVTPASAFWYGLSREVRTPPPEV